MLCINQIHVSFSFLLDACQNVTVETFFTINFKIPVVFATGCNGLMYHNLDFSLKFLQIANIARNSLQQIHVVPKKSGAIFLKYMPFKTSNNIISST